MEATTIPEFETPMLAFLQDAGIDFSAKGHSHYKFQHCAERSSHSDHTCSHGFMDLIVETWWEDVLYPRDRMIISVCHYGLQNGDLMKDPEIVYRWDGEFGIETPTNFYNDYTGLVQEVFPRKDGIPMISPDLLKELQSFTKTWVENLKAQGHKLVTKEVEKE